MKYGGYTYQQCQAGTDELNIIGQIRVHQQVVDEGRRHEERIKQE